MRQGRRFGLLLKVKRDSIGFSPFRNTDFQRSAFRQINLGEIHS
nr:MAG TPA: hypothetical protein [Caudoviricetes sp.]